MTAKTPSTKKTKKTVKKLVTAAAVKKSAGNPEKIAADRKAYRTGAHTPKARTAGGAA